VSDRLRKELCDELAMQIERHCRGHRDTEPTCNEVIEIVAARYPLSERGRIAHFFGWPLANEDDPDLMTITVADSGPRTKAKRRKSPQQPKT
jgi:hypothetical protein